MAAGERLGEALFRKALGFEEASKLRRFETHDIAKRLGVISADHVFINGYPVSNPIAVFNPACLVEGDMVKLYARVILGYYKYVSGIVEIPVPLEDIVSGYVSHNYYSSTLIIMPSTKYDLWGAEDPRAYRLGDLVAITYTGRTISYFNPAIRRERTLPITAVRRQERWNHSWAKVHAYTLPGRVRSQLISDKDAYVMECDGEYMLFHRPHLSDENWYLTLSWLPREAFTPDKLHRATEPIEVQVMDTVWVLREAPFEVKVGWATPAYRLKPCEYIALIHGVDREVEAYRVFAVHLEIARREVVVKAVTPRYIMEPRTSYEIFGDRPYVVFPCGLDEYEKGKLLLSYGAADFMVGLAEISLDDLLAELDRGRIY